MHQRRVSPSTRCRRDRYRTLQVLLFLSLIPVAHTFDCANIESGGAKWDLSALGGPQHVSTKEETPPTISEMKWTIDPCAALKKDPSIPQEDQCPEGTQVCGVERITHGNITIVRRVIPVAGEYGKDRGLSEEFTRLKTSKLQADNGKEGVRVVLHGGLYPDKKEGKKQSAVVDFLCERKADKSSEMVGKMVADGKEDKKDSGTLKFVNYSEADGLLKLEWLTEHACEKAAGGDDGGHWGFFTWLVIIAFLGIAAYLIFGSWFNYNRYGARGWDLLPHGDTIRELPYVVGDWFRQMINTLQGGGMRGGYSAV